MKQGRVQWVLLFTLLTAFGCGGGGGGGSSSTGGGSIDADDAIVGIRTIGFMAADAVKLSAIAVEYSTDLTGADVDENTYEIDHPYNPWIDGRSVNFGGGEIGDITRVYVNDKPEISAAGGSGTGKFVIVEVYTGYQYAAEQNTSGKGYLRMLAAGAPKEPQSRPRR
jgi:hypothetical protein